MAAVAPAMNVYARTSVLILLASAIPFAAVCQIPGVQSRNSGKQLLAEAIQGEKLSDSGRLCFRLRAEGEGSISSTMGEEGKDIDRIEYSWAPGGRFRIALIGKTGPIRTVVSDGKVISTGGRIWDARFAWGYNQYGTDASFLLEQELSDSMWAYSYLLYFHLHPLSLFRNKRTIEEYSAIYEGSMKDMGPASASNANITTLNLGGRHYHEFLQIGRGGIAYAHTNQPPGSIPHGLIYERTDPIRIDGVGWVPRACTIAAEPTKEVTISPYRWTSELCPDQPAQAIDPAEFAIKYTASNVIPWPYGSRMKNYWYAVVNTFKDMWEGISDGIIGD